MNPYILRNRLYLKEFLRKPIFLAAAIFYALSAGLGLIMDLLAVQPLQKMTSYMLNSANTALPENLSFQISFSIPLEAVAATVAFILIYKASKNPNPAVAPTAGLTILWALCIYNFVSLGLSALLLLAVIALLILVLANPNAIMAPVWNLTEQFIKDYGVTSSLDLTAHEMAEITFISLLVSMILVTVIFIALYLFIAISYFKFTSSLRNSARTEYLSSKGSRRYGIINLISAISSFLSAAYLALCTALMFIPEMSEAFGIYGLTSYDLLPLMIGSVTVLVLSGVLSVLLSKIGFGYRAHILAAGEGGENLPLPVIVSADLSGEQSKAAPVDAADNTLIAVKEELSSEEVSASEPPAVEAPADPQKISMQNANPEAKQLVEDVLDNLR